MILLTSERVISVWFPFKCKELCSRRRIVVVWLGIFIALFGVNSHFFVTYDLKVLTVSTPSTKSTMKQVTCFVFTRYSYFWYKQWYWISGSFRDFIPFVIILVGNVSIVSRIVVANRLRKSQMQATGAKIDKVKGTKVSNRSEICDMSTIN